MAKLTASDASAGGNFGSSMAIAGGTAPDLLRVYHHEAKAWIRQGFFEPLDPSIYNDRDGTRNDIGMYGGHGYLPNGRTTTKPIVLSLEIEPLAVPVGGVITIESTGATVK